MEYKYREGLAQLPIYDVTECDWNIKVNANECNLNLPPAVEDRGMGRLSRVAFNRYPNTEAEDLKEQKKKLWPADQKCFAWQWIERNFGKDFSGLWRTGTKNCLPAAVVFDV